MRQWHIIMFSVVSLKIDLKLRERLKSWKILKRKTKILDIKMEGPKSEKKKKNKGTKIAIKPKLLYYYVH